MTKYLCIHGHFYQPPRENPWIEEIERQDSAAPFHDWNERILKECYEPNCHARIVDAHNRITDIVNNYEQISFNFGPTLLSWLEKKAPDVYRHILAADRESMRRLGHGNAIAQAYNHIILPLANDRDKETQIIWGIEDFKRRFGRAPHAMWLPETAVDEETVEALIKHGISWIILSPTQAQSVRKLSGGAWKNVADGSIDTTRPYRCFVKKDGAKVPRPYLDVFFFNAALSGEISFGNLLDDGDRFAERLNQAFNSGEQRAQLVNVATDGETYGHHRKFGEMALAYALRKATQRHGFTVTNYGAFLAQFPPEWEVALKPGPHHEGTSWSCAHGVSRWKDDCGCKVNWQSPWNQRWRKPLRDALNLLRDKLAVLFASRGAGFFQDPWAARNDYISIIMDRRAETITRFLSRTALRTLTREEQIDALKLLEMQRHTQLMFTSCGWFFDDVSGIETAQILMCADRALYLAESFTAEDLEIPFAAHLAAAQSNIAGLGTGTDIYYRTIKPARMSVEKIVHQFLMLTALKEAVPRSELFYTYQIDLMDHHKKTKGKAFLFAGRAHTVSSLTTETRAFFFALAYQGSYYFKCAVVPVSQTGDVLSLQNELMAAFDASPETIFQDLEKLGGEHCYSLHDLLPEAKQAVLRLIIDKEITAYHDMLARAFDDNRETVEAALREGLIIPPEFKIAAEHTLSNRLEREIEQYGEQIGELEKRGIAKGILQQAHQFGYSLRTAHAERILCHVLKQKIIDLKQDVSRAAIEEIERFLAFIRELDLRIDLTDVQNLFYETLKNRVGARPEKVSGGSEDQQTIAQALANLAVNLGFSGEVCGVGHQK
jgi:alpha-amylase/alpha-mannosidase (GH57 family)